MCVPLNMSRPGLTWDSVIGLGYSGHICVYFDSLARVPGARELCCAPGSGSPDLENGSS